MSLIPEAFRAHVLGDAAIAALVQARMYPSRLPQKVVVPAITYGMVSEDRSTTRHLRGPGGLARPRYQLDCYAATFDGARALDELCRLRLDCYSGLWTDNASPAATSYVKIFRDDDAADLFDEDILGGLCRVSVDYFIHHKTTGGGLAAPSWIQSGFAQ